MDEENKGENNENIENNENNSAGYCDEDVKKALLMCAVGFSTGEVVEEYAVVGEEIKLVKKKITTRDVPPDIKAVKMLIDCAPDEMAMTDEQLRSERERLLKLLKEENNG